MPHDPHRAATRQDPSPALYKKLHKVTRQRYVISGERCCRLQEKVSLRYPAPSRRFDGERGTRNFSIHRNGTRERGQVSGTIVYTIGRRRKPPRAGVGRCTETEKKDERACAESKQRHRSEKVVCCRTYRTLVCPVLSCIYTSCTVYPCLNV